MWWAAVQEGRNHSSQAQGGGFKLGYRAVGYSSLGRRVAVSKCANVRSTTKRSAAEVLFSMGGTRQRSSSAAALPA